MTKQRALKRLIRERMAKTGESYTTARHHLLGLKDQELMSDNDIHPQDALHHALGAVRAGDLDRLQEVLQEMPQCMTARDADDNGLVGAAALIATNDISRPANPGTPDQHEAVSIILDAGADPNETRERDGWRPIFTAVMAANVDLTRRLLEGGAHQQGGLMGADGGTPLSLSLFYGEAGPVTDLLTRDGPFPDNLRNAAAMGQPMDRFFQGDDLTDQARDGCDFYRPIPQFPEWNRRYDRQELLDEALCWAAHSNQIDAMAFLAGKGANVNHNPYRGTPLTWAVSQDRVEAVTWLLAHGADPNLKHDFGGMGHGVGAVAMHLAIQYRSLGSLRILLENGADPTIKDDIHGGDAMGWARFHGSEGAVPIIEEFWPE